MEKPKAKIYQGYAWLPGNGHTRSNGGRVKRSVLVLEEKLGKPVQTGEFGKYMNVSLINDGPVTIIIDTKEGG